MAIERREGERPFLARVYVKGKRGPSRAFYTRHEAEAWEATARAAMMQGGEAPAPPAQARESPLTVLEASRDAVKAMLSGAMRTVAGREYRRSSVEAMEARLRLHVVPRIGGQRVADLDRAAVVRLREDILRATTPATAAESIAALSVVLRRCVDRGSIQSNPTRGLPPLAREKERPAFLTREQAAELIERARQYPDLGLIVELAIATGLRRGELVALRWEDVRGGAVHVVRARGRHGEDGPLKTDNAERVVPLGRQLQAHLENLRTTGAVFGDFPRRAWDKVRPPGIRFHDLRHTAATLWLAAGMNVHEVAQLLGHADAQLVLTRYGHALPTRLSAAGQVMEDYLAGGAPGGVESKVRR